MRINGKNGQKGFFRSRFSILEQAPSTLSRDIHPTTSNKGSSLYIWGAGFSLLFLPEKYRTNTAS